MQGQTAWIGSIGQNHRGFARLGISANLVDNIEDIPPSLRFFAGGDNSLRGYDYQSVSPVDEDGELIGAKYMATGTLEYQYRLTGNWWLATFVDAGDAWSESSPELKKGLGAGIRWVSPVGPVRLDFAWGQDEFADHQLKIHFTLGPEL
jgi:translocation and assembly module TamA